MSSTFLFIKMQPNMRERERERQQEKKRQRIYDELNAETKLKFLCLSFTNQRKIFTQNALQGKGGFKKKEEAF